MRQTRLVRCVRAYEHSGGLELAQTLPPHERSLLLFGALVLTGPSRSPYPTEVFVRMSLGLLIALPPGPLFTYSPQARAAPALLRWTEDSP